MCGICGIFHTDTQPVDSHQIKKMTDMMYHRGPDGDGFFIQDNIGLGHRRLAIIDLDTGDQPLFNEDKSVAVVFNGEIYNFHALRRELTDKGHRFSTQSDTEVIVHAYEEWGLDCVSRFNGMWAFGLWDSKKQGLLVSRDRIGEKPLYYCYQKGTFYFASEIKGLLAAGLPQEADLRLIAMFLALGYIPAPYSFYKNIHKLLPGHSLWIDSSGVSDMCYWKFPVCDEKEMVRDEKKAKQTFSELFAEAVRIRMYSDVPFGAFLSGGLDSSSIVSEMAKVSDIPISTFTIGFEEKEFDERDLALLAAEEFRTNHYEHVVENRNFKNSIETILTCYDEPFGDSSAIPTGAVSAFAKTRVKMVLTGDGGDEVLSGYPSYQGEKLTSSYRHLPRMIRSIIRLSWQVFRPFSFGGLRYKWNRIDRSLGNAEHSFFERLVEKAFLLPSALLKQLTAECGPQIDPAEFILDQFKDCRFTDPFYQLMYFHSTIMLPDDMLTKVDRMSMFHSLEARIPFLDYRLVEFCASLHKNIKMKGFERKSLLKSTVGRSLPRRLLTAPKKYFMVPHREWFKQKSFKVHLDNLHSLKNYGLNEKILASIFQEHISGKLDYGQLIWSASLLKQWLKKRDTDSSKK